MEPATVNISLDHDPRNANDEQLTCADVFVISGLESDPLSIWTDPDNGTYWPRDLVPKDIELKSSCRVWTITLRLSEQDFRYSVFKECVPLQNFAFRALWTINEHITSESPFGDPPKNPEREKQKAPNNSVIALVAHGLGGIYAQQCVNLILQLPLEDLRTYYPGLKLKNWRLIGLGCPHFNKHGGPMRDGFWQVRWIVENYGGNSELSQDAAVARDHWWGMQRRLRLLIDNDWEAQGIEPPETRRGTLKIASFRAGLPDAVTPIVKEYQNVPNVDGWIVIEEHALFGDQGLYGFAMSDAPSPVLPRNHKTLGQFKDENDPCYLAVRSVLIEMLKAE